MLLDAAGEQDNEDDDPTPLDTSELPPDDEVPKKKKTSDSSSEKKAVMKPINITQEDIRVMYDQARSLSYAQRVIFDKIIHYVRCVAIERKGGIIKPDPPMILVNGMLKILTLTIHNHLILNNFIYYRRRRDWQVIFNPFDQDVDRENSPFSRRPPR